MKKTSVIVSHVSTSSVPGGEVVLPHICRVCEEETECIKHKAGFSCLSCRAFLRRIIVRRSRARRSTASPEKEEEQDLLSYIKFSHDNFLFQAGLKLLFKILMQ